MNEQAGGSYAERFMVRPAAYRIANKRSAAVTLLASPRHENLGVLSPVQRRVLKALAGEPTNLDELVGPDDHDEVAAFVGTLHEHGWLSRTVVSQGQRLYTVKPFAAPSARPVEAAAPQVLSKFTVIRRHHGELVLENPRSWCDIHVHDARLLPVVCGLPEPAGPALPPEVGDRLLADLRWAGCVVDEAAEQPFSLLQWSAHELWFHHRSTVSRRGWEWEPFAATNWARGRFEPLPARRPPYGALPIPLAVPDLDQLRRSGPSLTAAIEDRHSCRSYDDDRPVTVDQLAELLYRAARTRGVAPFAGREVTSRPYPSGGGVYELELYPVVRKAAGLPAGMYHYDSVGHELRPIAVGGHPLVERLLYSASFTLTDRQRPQVLIVIAARAGRLMWTYEQMPYAMILKHVGTLTQTMYLVATAMGLGVTALGTGDAAAFNDVTGTDQTEECAVGDFAIGTPSPSLAGGYRGVWEVG